MTWTEGERVTSYGWQLNLKRIVRKLGNGEGKNKKQTHHRCYLQGFSRGRWHQQALVVPFMEAFDVSYRLLRGEWQPWVLIPFRE